MGQESAQILRGKRVIVLGSTSGIGRATALAVADAGGDLIVHGRRSREEAESVADVCRSRGVRAAVLMADLADSAEGDRLVEDAWTTWDGLDAWVHIAGVDTLTEPASSWSFDQKFAMLLNVDVKATVRLCRAIGRKMKAAGGGAIVTMGWDQAETGMEGDSGELFAATKGAVMAFTRSLSLSLAPEVRVNCVAPGWIKTAWGRSASRTWQDRVLAETPLKRWGEPEDVARAVRFLIGPEAEFLTGQIVRINGGVVR